MSATPISVRRGRQALLIGLVSTVFVACRVWWATLPNLDPDEAFSLRLAKQPWGEFLAAVSRDIVHPPLFYGLLKVWLLIVGEHIALLRLLPVTISAVTIIPTYLLCRELKVPTPVANLAVLLIGVNPFLVRYSQELRMYSTLLLLGTSSLWLLLRFSRAARPSQGLVIVLTGVNLLLVYTHYLGWILIALEAVYVFFAARPRLWAFSAATLVVGIAFLPWAAFVIYRSRQAAGLGGELRRHLSWTQRPDWRDLITYFARLNGPVRSGLGFSKGKIVTGLALFGAPAAVAIWRDLRPRDPGASATSPRWTSSTVLWLTFFAAGPVFIPFVVSYALPVSILEPRYLILAAIPYLILCSVGFWSLKSAILRSVAITAAILWAVLGLREEVRLGDRVDWIHLVEEMRQAETADPSGSETVRVYTFSSGEPFRYVLERDEDRRFRVQWIRDPQRIEGVRFWLAYQESYWNPEATLALRRELDRKGYRLVREFQSGIATHRVHLGLFAGPALAADVPRPDSPR